MKLKKGTPGGGGQVRADSFSYTPIKNGLRESFNAWLAGPVYWMQAHEHTEKQPGTKPCLEWMTDGALRCPRCRPQVVPTWIGYVPLYRGIDHQPIMVIVHESAMDLLHELSYPTYVLVGRVDAKSSVFVRKSDNPVSFKTDNEQRKRPVDITTDLLSMWKIPALESWLLADGRNLSPKIQTEVSNAGSVEPKPAVDTGSSDSNPPLLGDSWLGALSDKTQAEIRKRRNEIFVTENKNGKHKKPTGSGG